MSLTEAHHPDYGDVLSAAGQTCFYCRGLILADPVVHWMGAYGHLYLHPPCVLELMIRLMRDVHSYEIKYGKLTDCRHD